MLVSPASSTASLSVGASTKKAEERQDSNSSQKDKSDNGQVSLRGPLALAGAVTTVGVVVAMAVAAVVLASLEIVVPRNGVAKESTEKASANKSGQPDDEGNADMGSGVDARLPFLA